MAKFEVEVELTGFRLKVKAERDEDVARITQQLSGQLTAVTQPFAGIVPSRRVIDSPALNPPDGNREAISAPGSPEKIKRRPARRNGERRVTQPVTWQHDSATWGTPRQAWTACQKILWVIYVMTKVQDGTEFAGPTIAESFNRAFRQFGPLNKKNMPRDLGMLKKKTPAQVMDNSSASPMTWYLTEEGIKEAEKLIIEAKGPTTAAIGEE